MLDRNSGRIIVISSEAAFKPVPMMIHYSYTKAAQVNIARGMAELTRVSTPVFLSQIRIGLTWGCRAPM